MTLDDIRARHPDLALALYALEPGGLVTLEVVTPDGESFRWEGSTEAAVLTVAFPGAATPPEPSPQTPPEQDIFA